jgi:acylphosphatase
MKRAVIIAKGEVQRVGYRDAVEKIARGQKIKGFVANLKPYDVRILAEGEDANIDQFIERIKIKKFPIDVEELELRFEDFKDEFDYFEIKREAWQEELGERLDTAGTLLYRVMEFSEQSVELGKESVSIGKKMLEKQDMMLEKQDMMLEKQDMMLEKQDMMLEKQDETVEEIKGVREDLKAYLEARFVRIEREIAEIKAKIGIF